MGDRTRVILMDLLVERSQFGHGGNQEVIDPISNFGDVEVLLVTPQMQTEEVGFGAQNGGLVGLTLNDVPHWDHEFEFWEECNLEMNGNDVLFKRIAMPLEGDDAKMRGWLGELRPQAVVCSGSRRNVTMWEDWMDGGGSLIRCSAMMGIPTLGICFGHQLLCKALGSTVERADSLSNGVWDLELTEEGDADILFSSRRSGEKDCPAVLFTHQDHVITVPDSCSLLGSTIHNGVTAVRVRGEDGSNLPSWGVQFHPEAARARVERAFESGHISEEELEAFRKDHDGAGILQSFASVVNSNTGKSRA
ncbi:MAG TPA: gamma-glutamyl-gamma-aminobutyrate hydrolase family protein [Candidatus Thalassarchaeaceae archaeon]|nr:gamma-glutamyl-gamma-aminobutyrate hydrolase family protein [Candidatus Thalassarchaeaceae archaeon]